MKLYYFYIICTCTHVSCIHVRIKKITVKIADEFSWSDLKAVFTLAFPLSSCIIQYKSCIVLETGPLVAKAVLELTDLLAST